MALRGSPEECSRAAEACVRAYRAIERVIVESPPGRDASREAADLLQAALTALDAASHAIMGSASETKRGRMLLAQLQHLADAGETEEGFVIEGRKVARQLNETAVRLKKDLVKIGKN